MVSPDGQTAAIARSDPTGELDLLDVRSGAQTTISLNAGQVAPVWSLDGRYLFFVNDYTNFLAAVDRTTGSTMGFLTQVKQISSLAVRPAL